MKNLLVALFIICINTILSAQMMSEKIFDFYSSLDLLDAETREKKLQAAIKSNPKEPWYYLIHAEFAELMGQKDIAEKDYKAALAVNGSSGPANGLYARFLYTSEPTDERLKLAMEYIDKAIKLDPAEGYYLIDKGNIYLELNQFAKAIECADLVIKKFEEFGSDAIELKVKVYYAQGDQDKLHRFFKQTPEIMDMFFVDLDFVLLVGSIYEDVKMFDNACGIYLGFADFLSEMEEEIPSELAEKIQRCE